VSGRSDALARCFAHESRRQHRRLRLSPDERRYLDSLTAPGELEAHVRGLSQVDRAVRQAQAAAERGAA
jgi:hypothetical protein